MARLELQIRTPVPPGRIRAALLDFTERRPELWPGLSASLYEVFWVKETEAEIQEGTRMPGMTIRAREHYDWSDPEVVRWEVVESTFSQTGDFVEARILPDGGGPGSVLHITWSRRGKTLAAKALVGMLVATRGAALKATLRQALRRIAAADHL